MKYNANHKEIQEKIDERAISWKKDITEESIKSVLKNYPIDYISNTCITRNDIENELKSVSRCSNNLVFGYENSLNDGVLEPIAGGIIESDACCNTILCSNCASIKRNALIASVAPKIRTMEKMSGLRYYMLTITIKSVKINEIKQTYNRLRQSWTKFTKKGQLRRKQKRSRGEASKFIGTILGIECAAEENDTVLVHGHVLIVADKEVDYRIYEKKMQQELIKKYGYGNIPEDQLDAIVMQRMDVEINGAKKSIPVSKLSREWIQSTGGYGCSIECTPIYSHWYFDKEKGKYIYQSLVKSLYEVIKYPTKMWEFTLQNITELWIQLSGVRRLTKSGIFTKNGHASVVWSRLLEKNKMREVYEKLVIDYKKSTVTEELHRFGDAVDTYEKYRFKPDVGYQVVNDNDDYYQRKYNDLQSYNIYNSMRAHIVNGYKKIKIDIKSRIGIDDRKSLVDEKDRVTKIMRSMLGDMNRSHRKRLGLDVDYKNTGYIDKWFQTIWEFNINVTAYKSGLFDHEPSLSIIDKIKLEMIDRMKVK